MNAILPRSYALLGAAALAGLLPGCVSGTGHGMSGEAAAPVRDSAAQGVGPALVNLYGELQTDWLASDGVLGGSSRVSQVTFASEGACSDPDVSRDGAWMTFASNQHGTTRDLYMRPVDGGTLTQLTTDPSDDIMPALHPSGKKIAFASNRTGNWDIYVMDIDGGQTTKLTDDVDHELHPSWAPDGKRLVYCKLGSQSGRWEMWSVDTSKPGVHRFLDYGLFPQWCPDVGRPKILFQRARQRGSRYFSAWTVDYVNGEAVHRTEIVSAGNAAVINPSWSPDGSRIVFVTVVDPETNLDGDSLDQSDLWIINLDGSGRTNLTDGRYANYQPMWSTDDRVYFVSNRSGVDNIWSVPAARALDSISPRTSRFRSAERGAMEDEFDGRP